jgi:hypothetical protein
LSFARAYQSISSFYVVAQYGDPLATQVEGVCAVKLAHVWRDLVFRGIAFATLSLFAFGFMWNHTYGEHKQESKQTAEERRLDADERVADYTLCLGIFTGGLFLSTFGLWIVTWRSGIKQGRETRRSLRVSARSADAAKKSADAAVGALRPWVTFTQIDIGDFVFSAGSASRIKRGEHSFANPGQLESLLRDAGFGAVVVSTAQQTIVFPSVLDYVRFQLIATPMTMLLRDKTEPERQAIISSVASTTATLSTPAMLDGGKFAFLQEAYVAIASPF